MVVTQYDRKRKGYINVLVLPGSSTKLVPGSLQGYKFDRVLMKCFDCKRHHYATVLDCPPADAKTYTFAGVEAVVEDAD